jgi:holo-[acyl-carrier protein] synthase
MARRRAARRAAGLTPRVGCGVDVVEVERFRRAMARGGRAFMRRVFTAREEAYARARPRTALLHLAGRFAAKEAVIKALSQLQPKRLLAMHQVEVRNDRLGRPHIVLRDGRRGRPRPAGRESRGGLTVHVSLSHVESVAVASAIAIGE